MGIGIQICGLNGCGKSTLGKALAERIGFYFIDNEFLYFSRPNADRDKRTVPLCSFLLLCFLYVYEFLSGFFFFISTEPNISVAILIGPSNKRVVAANL